MRNREKKALRKVAACASSQIYSVPTQNRVCARSPFTFSLKIKFLENEKLWLRLDDWVNYGMMDFEICSVR